MSEDALNQLKEECVRAGKEAALAERAAVTANGLSVAIAKASLCGLFLLDVIGEAMGAGTDGPFYEMFVFVARAVILMGIASIFLHLIYHSSHQRARANERNLLDRIQEIEAKALQEIRDAYQSGAKR